MSCKPAKCARKGTAAVEFALVAPVFFLLVLGIFEFGRGFMVTQLLTNTARETCRKGILPGVSTSTIQSLASQSLSDCGISGATTTVQVNGEVADAITATTGDKITVLITIPFNQVFIVPSSYLSGNFSAQWTLRHM